MKRTKTANRIPLFNWTTPVFVVFTVLLCTPQFLHATEKTLEIIGDRPDFTESAATVPPIHLQGETGVAYSTIGDEKDLTAPNLLLRLGVIEHLELRVGTPSAQISFANNDVDTDPSGLETGLKIAAPINDKWAIGVLPYAVWPIKKNHWNAAGLELGIRGLWAVDITDIVSLGGNVGVVFYGVTPQSADFEPEYLASLSLGISILEWLGTFIEVYGLMNNDADVTLVADGGFTFLAAPWLQLDVHTGVGLTTAAHGFDVGAGAIFLF